MYNTSEWLANNEHELRIGQPDCLALANKSGTRGRSCYIVFVSEEGVGDMDVALTDVMASSLVLTRPLDHAVQHQRCHHFDHRPFVCIPVGGQPW